MNRATVDPAVARECFFYDRQCEYRRGFRPSLVGFFQTGKQFLKFLRLVSGRYNVGPGLFVVRRSGPSGRFKQRAQFVCGHVAVFETVGAPSFRQNIVDRMIVTGHQKDFADQIFHDVQQEGI